MKISQKTENLKRKPEGITANSKIRNKVKDKLNYRKKLSVILKSTSGILSEHDTDNDNEGYLSAEYKHVRADVKTWKINKQNNKSNHLTNGAPVKFGENEESLQETKFKKLIKNKGTLQTENEMLNVISDIVGSVSKSFVPKVPIKRPETTMENGHAASLFSSRVLDRKMKARASERKQNIVHRDLMDSPSSTLRFLKRTDFTNRKRNLNQDVNYKYSVMEIFNTEVTQNAVANCATLHFDNSKIHHKNKTRKIRKVSDRTQKCKEIELNSYNVEIDEPLDYPQLPEPSENPVESPVTVTPPQETKVKFLTFQNCCILLMRPDTSLYFCGKLKATLIHGNVDILGHKMDSVCQEIYSLSVSSLLYFHSHQHADKDLDMSILSRFGFSEHECAEILKNISKADSVLLLQPHSNIMTDFVTKHFPFNVFVKEKSDEEITQVFKVLQCLFFTDGRRGSLKLNLLSSPIAQKILRCRGERTKNVTMICGGKNSGKSTFLKYLVNQCVSTTPTLVLDFDPGQPEFTVCGLISATLVSLPLLGPNFTHLMNPERSLVLGFINISENEERYLSCVQDLFKYCLVHGKYSGIPWIINMSGFTGPIGLKLAAFIMNIAQPTMVVELINTTNRLNFDMRLKPENMNAYQNDIEFSIGGNVIEKLAHEYEYYELDPFALLWTSSKPSLCRNIEPKDERLLNLVAYFSQVANQSLSVLDNPPYVISLDDISLAFNNMLVDAQYMYGIVNSKVVALCHDDNVTDTNNSLVNIDLFSCYGYGIVRGIDLEQRKIFITSPVNPSQISFVNVLVYGECLPDCSFMTIGNLPEGTVVPYTMSYHDAEFNKQMMKTPRRKFNPFRLLELKNKS